MWQIDARSVGEPLEDALEARQARELVGVRSGADVDDQDAVELDEPRVHGPEARVVRVKSLHLGVELQPRQPPGPARLVDQHRRVVVSGVHGAERDPVREPRGGVPDPAVELPRHPRPVGVREEREALDPGRAQRRDHLVGLGGPAELPVGMLVEPAADRREEPRRVEMGVGVEVPEPGRRLHPLRPAPRAARRSGGRPHRRAARRLTPRWTPPPRAS